MPKNKTGSLAKTKAKYYVWYILNNTVCGHKQISLENAANNVIFNFINTSIFVFQFWLQFSKYQRKVHAKCLIALPMLNENPIALLTQRQTNKLPEFQRVFQLFFKIFHMEFLGA